MSDEDHPGGDGASPEEVEAAWLVEAKRRSAAIERGEMELVDADAMMARLRARIHSRDVVAKIERSLAQLDAGQVVPHAEVLAMIEARYPGLKE